MRKRKHRVGLAAGAGLFGLALSACGQAVSSQPVVEPAPLVTAADACRASAGGSWEVAVEVDRSDGSALALASGDSIASCLVSRSTDGTGFGSTAVGIGLHPRRSSTAVTFVTAQSAHGTPNILIGRAPAGTSSVRVVSAEGSVDEATLGGDLWLAWLAIPGKPTLIQALDASGKTISQIEDASGLQPAD